MHILRFHGSEEVLNQTKNTQLAILTMSLGILEVLKQKGICAEVSSGLSLGEYTALINSGAISLEEGVKLVQKRGGYMQELVPEGNWSMAAILGMTEEQVQEVCDKVTNGFVVPANFNTIGQIVISGEQKAIEQAQEIAKELGAKKVSILKTAGPFHTEKLSKASDALKEDLETITIHPLKVPVVKNLDGELYRQEDDIKEILAKHMISPVKFSKSLETMLEMGIDTFMEIGPRENTIRICKKNESTKGNNDIKYEWGRSIEQIIDFSLFLD